MASAQRSDDRNRADSGVWSNDLRNGRNGEKKGNDLGMAGASRHFWRTVRTAFWTRTSCDAKKKRVGARMV